MSSVTYRVLTTSHPVTANSTVSRTATLDQRRCYVQQVFSNQKPWHLSSTVYKKYHLHCIIV